MRLTPPSSFGDRVQMAVIACVVALVSVKAWAEPVIFAAASTRAPLDQAVAQAGQGGVVSYGASGTIARQIAEGAPADVFISANPEWMSYLIEVGLVDKAQVKVLTSNRLVLISPLGQGPVDLTPEALSARLGREYFAVADPSVAPVGKYGQGALSALGLLDTLAPVLLPTRNTTATVATVASGEAALGLVYSSDVAGVAGVTVVAELPESAHAPIEYLIAPVSQGEDPDGAAALIAYLMGDAGQAVFEAAGFAPVGEGS